MNQKNQNDMKTTAVMIVILFLATAWSMAQYNDTFREKPPPAIYLSYQPADHALGIRGDYHFNFWSKPGIYGSGSYGQWGLYKWSELGQHIKLTTGILIPYKDGRGNQHDFSLGLNYHWVSGQVVESEIFKADPVFDSPWSFEIGVTIKMRRFALGMRTDILRWEPCIDVGIPLRQGRRKR